MDILEVNGVRLSPGTREVWSDGRQVELTTIEFDILDLIVRSAGRVVSRDELTAAIHQRPASPLDRSLDVHVSHLRKKLGRRGSVIRTVRGVGYLFRAELLERSETRPMKVRVRSIFTKIVLWFAVTVALSLVGFLVTSMFISARLSGRATIGPRMNAIFLDDARRAYEEGGTAQLDAYLKRLGTYSESAALPDRRPRDRLGHRRRPLATLVARRPPVRRVSFPAWLMTRSSPIVRVRTSDDRRYRLITVLPPTPGWDRGTRSNTSSGFPLLIGVLCYVLAVHLASPLRSLRRVVERFGRGELGIRFHLARQDEIGDLARSFNRMADHITTLLSAERRLLQDVSHELRSPLARLGFAVELAKTSTDRDAALGRIRKEADRLNRLVDELLQLTRAEGDPAARNLEEVNLGELLEDLVADCAVEAEAQGCRLVSRIDPSAVLTGDRELLRAPAKTSCATRSGTRPRGALSRSHCR